MQIRNLHVGYNPRKDYGPAMWCAVATCFAATILIATALFTLTPIHPFNASLGLLATWDAWDDYRAEPQINLRLVLSVLTGTIGACVTFQYGYRHTPLTEPFQQESDSDPRVYYGENARDDLRRRLVDEAGRNSQEGLYLAPHLRMPYVSETKNILAIGAPNSGKSNILRALADQAIDRGDRVLLLCNKGDVTSAFEPSERILIAAHHRDSHAHDLAADVAGVAAAAQFSTDVVPASSPPFWSDCARAVMTDIILTFQATKPGAWNARMLLRAALSDSAVIRNAITRIDLNASPLLQGSDPDAEDKTVTGILMTLRSAAFANLRPLAWAWDEAPPERRFSVKAWLSDDSRGPRTVIVQFSPEYGALSTLVAGSLIRRIAQRVADPQLAVSKTRRVVMVLDEFHILGKIDNIQSALAVGRDKGLVIMLGIQNFGQLVATYGREGANVLSDLFQIKIYGRLVPGESAKAIAEQLGTRNISAMVHNRSPGKDDTRTLVEERKTIPTFSATRLASKLGVFANDKNTGVVRAVVHCYGQCYVLDWPFTLWQEKRRGFIPAPWLTRPPLTRQAAPDRMSGGQDLIPDRCQE